MASKRHQRRRGCESKVRYGSKQEASHAAVALRKGHGGGTWTAYHCPFCGGWHAGRQRARQRRGLNDRRAEAAQ